MKDVNFVNNTKKQNPEIARWIRTSAILFASTLFLITVITIRQLFKINLIKQDITSHIHKNKELNKILEKKRKLVEAKAKLAKQLKTIGALQETPKKRLALVTNIYQSLPENIKLESISIKNSNLGISIICPDDQIASVFIKKISTFPQIRKIKITSIKSKNNLLSFNITGKLEKA